VVTDGENVGARGDDRMGELTEQDLVLGKKASKFIDLICLVGLVACIGVASSIFLNVPWDTRMPYQGKYSRDGSGIPMQIAMLPCLVVLFGFWRSGKKADAHHMGKASRIGLYILGTAIVVGCVVGQWVMASGILTAGGFSLG
jgi:hypothetical protein